MAVAKTKATRARAGAGATKAAVAKASASETFSADYYARYYESDARVHGAKEIARLASGVVGLVEWWQGAPIDSVLDVGAGPGHWGAWLRAHRPKARVRSTEASAFACATYGHEQRDITRWRAKERFDLVVCQGVLPYLDDAGCVRALENLAAMTGGFLYLEAITTRDVREVCDLDRTDTAVHVRPGSFYRRELGRHFRPVGAGLYCPLDSPALFYELEAPR